MTALQLNLWSDTPIRHPYPDGRSTAARVWVAELGVGFAPTVVLFDALGEKVVRLEAEF